MAKVAVHGSLSSNSLPFERGVSKVKAGTTMKRKTPSELRDEQLKRRSCAPIIDEHSASLLGSEKNTRSMASVTKKPDTLKSPRYIDTRVDEVYPARKSSNRLTMQYLKEKAQNRLSSEQSISQKDLCATSKFDPKSQAQPPSSETSAKEDSSKTCPVMAKCSQNTFHKVSDLSLGIDKSSASMNTSAISNMEALKTLGVREPPSAPHLPKDFTKRFGDHLSDFSTECHITGHKIPLDFTLKTSMKVVSSSSVKWCHRLINSSDFNGMTHFTPQSGYSKTEALFAKSLHSWTYPQSSLPPSVISALTASTGHGDTDFLSKRQMLWEDSFRNLYYMLRKNKCNVFYVCTPQFVVMFTSGYISGKKKLVCNAYLSQSTRGLRSLLKEQDISFSMPLCHSQEEVATAEDLVELLQIKKDSVGQTHRSGFVSDMDNSPQSLLAFTGNNNVHGLYDFLLNYKSFLSSLITTDVPLLCAPVLFRNASISVPEVKCKEMKKASLDGMCYSIEIKDGVLPPWVVSGICSAMRSSGSSFEASFTTESSSSGLNVALGWKEWEERNETYGMDEAVFEDRLRCAMLRGVKYSDDSYTAYLLPV